MSSEVFTPPQRAFLNRTEAAEYLGLSMRYLDELKARRLIPHYKRGRLIRFKAADLDAYMERFRVNAGWETKAR